LAAAPGKSGAAAPPRLRLDKWLWQARFFKSRSLANVAVSEGQVRVNGIRATRPSREVTPGDVLTFPLGTQIRVIRILSLGQRRGPASEAEALYVDLEPQGGPQSDLNHPPG